MSIIDELGQFPSFQEMISDIKEMVGDYEKALRAGNDTVQIYRAQGALEALEKVLEKTELDYRDSGQDD